MTVEIMTAHNGEYISHEVEVTLKPGSAEAIASNATEEEAVQEEEQQDQSENSDDSYDDFEDYNNQFNGEWNNEFAFPFGNGDSMF